MKNRLQEGKQRMGVAANVLFILCYTAFAQAGGGPRAGCHKSRTGIVNYA
jgi:hypothetical protein